VVTAQHLTSLTVRSRPGVISGLVGEEPGEKYEPFDEFARKNQGVWDGVVEKHGLKTGRLESYGWPFLNFIMDKFNFDWQHDLSKARAVGFKETIDTVKGYTIAFDCMRAAQDDSLIGSSQDEKELLVRSSRKGLPP